MSFVAIVGAGPLGGALAHSLAARHAAGRLGADHVMAGDVIEGLPWGLTLHERQH